MCMIGPVSRAEIQWLSFGIHCIHVGLSSAEEPGGGGQRRSLGLSYFSCTSLCTVEPQSHNNYIGMLCCVKS